VGNMDDPDVNTLVVTGFGRASTAPDRCLIAVTLRVMRDTVAEAVDEVASIADRVFTALRASGVASSEVRTVNLAVNDWIDHQQQKVTARVATYALTVHGATLAGVPALIRTLTDSAGDALHIDGITFEHSDPSPLMEIARRAAVADAHLRAGHLADAAGLRLGHVLNITEDGDTGGRVFARAMSGGAAAASVPISPGDLPVSARIRVTFSLEPRD
jgi:uncharacterized protein YggE